MPADNIERAIQRGVGGKDGVSSRRFATRATALTASR